MKKKLLALCYRPPLLGYSQNSQGQYHILQNAQKYFETRILSFKHSSIEVQEENYFKTNNSTILKVFNLLFDQKSPRLTNLWNAEFSEAFKYNLDEFKPDFIYVDHILMMQYPFRFSTNAKILLYNEESQLYINKYKLRKTIYEYIKNYGLSEYEKKAVSMAHINFMITSEESKYLNDLGFSAVKTLPYSVDDKFFYNNWKPDQSVFNILFVGDYAHYPNREAARLICKKIYPALKNFKIKITLVGRNISKISKYLNSEISFYENVKDVRPFYWESTLFVAPIFFGAGMRIKILEAAACGIPILMTPLANLGVNLKKYKEAYIEDNISDIIESIKSIYHSERTDLLKVSLNANKKVITEFSLVEMNKLYEEIFSELI